MGLQKHSDHTKLFVGHGFTGCGKTRFWRHSERSEESLFDLSPMHGEILRFAQNDKRTFSAASSAVTKSPCKQDGFSRWRVGWRVFTFAFQGLKPKFFGPWNVVAKAATHKD